MLITRRLEFDAGHRIPDHASHCRHLHGHRYALEITLQGNIIQQPGASANGMVMDFSDVKNLAQEHLVDLWDHAFLAYEGDTQVVNLLQQIPGHKTVLLDRIPTVENLALLAHEILSGAIRKKYGPALKLTQVRLYETPNCWADAVIDQI